MILKYFLRQCVALGASVLLLHSCAFFTSDSQRGPSATGVRGAEVLQNFLQSSEPAREEIPKFYQSLSAKRKNEVKTLKENVLKFMLYAKGKSDSERYKIFQEAREYASYEMENIAHNMAKEKNLGNFSEKNFRKITQVPQWTLEEEIEYLRSSIPQNYTLTTKDIHRLNSLLSAFNQVDENLFEIGLNAQDDITEEKQLLSEIFQVTSETKTDRERALKITKTFEKHFQRHEKLIREMGTTLSESPDLQMGDQEMENFLRHFLNHYYSNLPDSSINNILSDLLHLGHPPNHEETLKALLRNSGPGLGKAFQQLAKNPEMGASLAELLETMESENKEVPYYLVKRLVKNDPANYKLTNLSRKPLGTGTVAQVNKATLSLGERGKETVAVRFLKPNIENLANQDIEILKSFVRKMKKSNDIGEEMLASIEKMVSSLESFLLSELDINDTIKKQLKAREVYHKAIKVDVEGQVKEVDVKVPKVYPPNDGVNTRLHVQEFANMGQKFSDLESPKAQEAISRAIVRMWFEEALLESGHIHADLHQGNFTALIAEGGEKIQVTLFDFGMSEDLSEKSRKAFIYIGSGSFYDDTKLIAQGFQIMDQRKSFKEYRKLIESERAKGEKTTDEWIMWGVKNGHLHSDELGSLGRGSALVNQLPAIIGKEEISEDTVFELVDQRIKEGYFSRHFQFPLNRFEILSLGRSQVRQNCHQLIKKFFPGNP